MAVHSGKKPLSRRARRQRRKRIAAMRRIGWIVLAVAAVFTAARLLWPDQQPDAVSVAPTPEITVSPTPSPVPTPTPSPTPSPSPTPNLHPSAIGLYIPQGGVTSPRIRQSVFSGKWTKEKDIDCFEVIASNSEIVTGDSHKDMFITAWESYPDHASEKIGYSLRYTLADGSEISYTIRSPKDVAYTEYIECWLYDDVHQDGFYYSHLKESKMREETLITSIKLTCGRKIAEVKEIHLGAFIYSSDADFDPEGRYIGDVFCEITILREE